MDWIKKYWEKALLLILFIGLLESLWFQNRDHKILKYFESGITLPFTYIDFTNKGGLISIKSGFTDLLVGSSGSLKKGEGYVVSLNIVNPSILILKQSSVIYGWEHLGINQAVTITSPNDSLSPAGQLVNSAFLSPIEGSELNSVKVSVSFDICSYKYY